MSLMTGDEMEATRSRTKEQKRRKVPTWWTTPVDLRAILVVFGVCAVRLVVVVVLDISGVCF